MKRLERVHPNSYKHLQDGGFVVHHTFDRKFNCVPTDQALKQIINRECKSAGGIVGFTRRKGALVRWIISRHTTAEYSGCLKAMTLSPHTERIHDECGQSRLKRDESDVLRIKSTVEDMFQNPFDISNVPKDFNQHCHWPSCL